MQIGQLILVRTNPTEQFDGALAQNAAATENILATPAGAVAGDGYADWGVAAGGTLRSRLKSLLIQSVENLAWEVWLWGKDTFNASVTDPSVNFPCGMVLFATGDAKRLPSSGLYVYYRDLLDIPYRDLDGSSELHLMLINRSAGAKTAGAGGAIQLQLAFEPTSGY